MQDRKDKAARRIVFVTGANGALGKELVKALLKQGDEVRGLVIDRQAITELPTGAIPFVGNLSDKHVLDSACDGADTVFHLAAITRESGRSAEEMVRVNTHGTLDVIDACRKNGVRHIIFTSTIDVYGWKRKGPIDETLKLVPKDKYGYSKMLAEQCVMRGDVPYTILRIATIYGPSFKSSFFKIFRAIKLGSIAIVGKGANHLALIHVNDVVRALLLVENNDDSIDKVYNLGDGAAYTQEQLIRLAAKMIGEKAPDRHVSELLVRMLAKQRDLESDELRFITADRQIDISKIERELRFKPSVSIDTGGRELVGMFVEKERMKSDVLGYK